MNPVIQDAKSRMEKSIESLRNELGKLRSGRASLALLDDIRVECYGSQMPINQVATLNIPEPRMITIQPWDSSVIPAIERAIMKSSLGLNPATDGKLIRLPLPQLTEERRKELVKLVRKLAEEHRVTVRNARREALEAAKKVEKSAHMSEDDEKKLEQEIQKLTDTQIKLIDDTVAHKEKEIMSV